MKQDYTHTHKFYMKDL